METTKHKITSDNYKQATFEQWAFELRNIYMKPNQERTPYDMWLRVVSDASKVGEEVRKGDPYSAMEELVHTFGWIITTCEKFTSDPKFPETEIQSYEEKKLTTLTEIVLNKYPGFCPYCQQKLCECSIRRKDNAGVKKDEKKKQQREFSLATYKQKTIDNTLPKNISELSEMFDSIYSQSHYEISLEKITFHFIEEVGEVAQCLTNIHDKSRNKDAVTFNVQLGEELADVVAWGFAVIETLSRLATDSFKLARIFMENEELNYFMKHFPVDHELFPVWIWKIFTDGTDTPRCHTCREEECACSEKKDIDT